ncbi:MAG: peptide ABC transporter substrate-binding protein [Clostridia bacterium]|nr:peptide ABC transporter substrate-binding protein [Clostridia bacterium]
MKHSVKRIIALLFILCFASGCYQGGSILTSPTPSHGGVNPPGQTAMPKQGGSITIAMPQEPYTTHPLFLKEVEMSNIYSMVFDPLIALDAQMLPAVSIANGWEMAESGEVTVRLRSGVRFHDNTELTSSDVVFTFNKILSSPTSIYYSLVNKYVLSVEAKDRDTVVFTPRIASYAFYYALNVPIIPEALYSGVDNKTDIIPIGTGSFAVGTLDVGPSSEMELVRNAYWWKKQPYIEKIHAVGFKDNNDAIEAFIRGELDCVPTAIYTTDIYDSYDGVSCYSYMSNYYDFLAPNLKNKALAEVNVRRAISYAIDRKSIIANIYVNHGITMEYPFASDFAFDNGDIIRYDHSLQQATALLDSAGWVMGDDSLRHKNGHKLSFKLITIRNDDNPVRRDSAQMLARQLAPLGISITIEVLNKSELEKALQRGDFDLLLTGYYLSDSPDLSFAFHSQGSGNVMNYSDPHCNELLDTLNAARTRDEYSAAYGELQLYISQQLPQIGLMGISQTLLHKDTLVPTGIYRDLRVYQNIDKWYLTN